MGQVHHQPFPIEAAMPVIKDIGYTEAVKAGSGEYLAVVVALFCADRNKSKVSSGSLRAPRHDARESGQ
jgi:hypothetical protein